jgi:biotin carboxylase
MSEPTILVVGAGLLQCYTIQEAHALGLRVICTDQSAHAPGVALADSFHALDIYDIPGHRALARQLMQTEYLVGVTCAGGDAAPTVAAVAEVAGLSGIPYEVARRTWDKHDVRLALDKAGLAHYQPRWQPLHIDRTDMLYKTSFASIVGEFYAPLCGGFPCVLKPVTQRASRGIRLVSNQLEVLLGFDTLAQYGPVVLLEERLVGSEHSAEIVFDVRGNLCHFHVCDRFFDYGTGMPLEVGHINPSRLPFVQRDAIKMMLLESASAMGVGVGSWKCDVMWTKDGPKILEATARCSGGFDAQVSYPRSSGDNLVQRILQVACALPVTPQPLLTSDNYCAVASIVPRKAGRVAELPMLKPFEPEVIWAIRAGETIQPPRHCAERAGFVVMTGKDYDKTWAYAQAWANAYACALAEVTVEEVSSLT